MPYRLSPSNKKTVQVKKGSKWTALKTHPSPDKAKKHLTALNMNVKHKK